MHKQVVRVLWCKQGLVIKCLVYCFAFKSFRLNKYSIFGTYSIDRDSMPKEVIYPEKKARINWEMFFFSLKFNRIWEFQLIIYENYGPNIEFLLQCFIYHHLMITRRCIPGLKLQILMCTHFKGHLTGFVPFLWN